MNWKSSLKGLTATKQPAPSRLEWQWDCAEGGAWFELITNYFDFSF
jgi:hypothetical protein